MHLKHNRKMTALVERFLRSLSIHLLVMFQSFKEGAFHANLVRIAAAHPIPSSVSVLARLVLLIPSVAPYLPIDLPVDLQAQALCDY